MNGRHRYYLYGLERVGGLLDQKMIGPYNWYEAGAQNLTSSQGGGGEWSNETETCYALLFLNKATASSTGGSVKAPGGKLSFAAEGEETEVVAFQAEVESELKNYIKNIEIKTGNGDRACRDFRIEQ